MHTHDAEDWTASCQLRATCSCWLLGSCHVACCWLDVSERDCLDPWLEGYSKLALFV